MQDIKGGQGENGSRHDHAATGPDRLYDDVFSQSVLPLESAGQPHADDSDRDGGLAYLTDLQAQLSGRRAEYHRHDQSPKDGPRRNLRIVFVGRHKRLVAFPFF